MADDLGERTEEATPRRLQEARAEGNVARSHDLASALMLLAALLALWTFAMSMLGQGRTIVEQGLLSVTAPVTDLHSEWETSRALGAAALKLALPVLLLVFAAAFLAHVLQTGWLFAPKAVQPSARKINPLNGLRRVFGMAAACKSGFDLAKVVLVIAMACSAAFSIAPQIVTLPYLSSLQAMREIGLMVVSVALRVLAALAILGVFDLLYQRWKHRRDLRMTRQQVKDEMKETEGDPETRRRRIRIQRQIALQRIAIAVPRADVIVTNPEHLSVAIEYDASKMNAPKVVAKGADHLALRIRLLAAQHKVPIVERKPLARALYKHVAVNQEVPAEYYKAVAEILAYVYRLSGRKAA